ncbi:MAG: hypothetical protein CME15_11495 [Gemmatimonadetes bacterium]|jgi:hypothetical protein|nr:hypothetical protein [Gemmatimonadota bacterium]
METVLDVAHQYPHRPGVGAEQSTRWRQLPALHSPFDGGRAAVEELGDTLFGDDRTGLHLAQCGNDTREFDCFFSLC